MGIKMPSAYSTDEKSLLTISQATILAENSDLNRQGLICSSAVKGLCRAAVAYVKAHERKCEDKQITISSFFRLRSKDSDHSEQCCFNTAGQVKMIARDSDANLFDQIAGGKYKLRLNILRESLIQIDREAEAARGKKPTHHSRQIVFTQRGKLDSYFRTARQIAELRERHEDAHELAQLVRLEFNNKTVSWSNFFYETDQHLDCYKYLRQLMPRAAHPICLSGYIQRIEPQERSATVETGCYGTIKLSYSCSEEDSDGFGLIASVALNIYSEAIWDSCRSAKTGKPLVAYCNYRVGKKPREWFSPHNPNVKMKYHNIYGDVRNRDQIFIKK